MVNWLNPKLYTWLMKFTTKAPKPKYIPSANFEEYIFRKEEETKALVNKMPQDPDFMQSNKNYWWVLLDQGWTTGGAPEELNLQKWTSELRVENHLIGYLESPCTNFRIRWHSRIYPRDSFILYHIKTGYTRIIFDYLVEKQMYGKEFLARIELSMTSILQTVNKENENERVGLEDCFTLQEIHSHGWNRPISGGIEIRDVFRT